MERCIDDIPSLSSPLLLSFLCVAVLCIHGGVVPSGMGSFPVCCPVLHVIRVVPSAEPVGVGLVPVELLQHLNPQISATSIAACHFPAIFRLAAMDSNCVFHSTVAALLPHHGHCYNWGFSDSDPSCPGDQTVSL